MSGPIRPDRGPTPIASALEQLLGTMQVPSVDLLDTVFRRWEDVVGAELARHTRPSSIDGDRLVVTADDAAWASEFAWLEREVVQRLAEVSGSDRISSVTVRVRRRDRRLD